MGLLIFAWGIYTELQNCLKWNENENKFINQIRAPGGHIQIQIMIDTQQYIKLNIRSEISIIVMKIYLWLFWD